MAGTKTLDPTTCKTASEAFKYPLPQIRQFHRSLTTELDEKNARLRTLVGGSYRQLLGTAEMILQMRDDIGVVEDGWREGGDMAWLARAKALDMCAVIVGGLLRRAGLNAGAGGGRNLVLAAKVLVLSRLLAKSLGDSAGERSKGETDVVEETRNKLGSLRRRLLRAIERTLEKAGGAENREDLLQAMCAYSLATSSGAKDVLRHFLHIRGEAMALAFEEDAEVKNPSAGVLAALGQYTRTLLDVQALAPRRLSEALLALKAKPLLKDETIRELEGLRLDVCERWFGDQITFFTPYLRHDDLEGPQVVETLRGWAKKASEVLLEGFSKSLRQIVEFKTVVELRTGILELWIKDGGKAKGFDPSTVLNGFRRVINDRMVELLESRAGKLHLVGTEIEASLGSWEHGTTDQHTSLWTDDLFEMEITHGASLFKGSVLARTNGRNDSVSRAIKGYQTWRHLIAEIITVLDQLKKQRWDGDLENIEDDDSIESRNTALSKEDPQMLQSHLDSSLENTYSKLEEKIASLLATYKDSENIGQMSVYILRILRDIRTELPQNSSLQGFGLDLVQPLHERLAIITSKVEVARFVKALTKKKVVGRGLWEGDPELPVQPSPRTFKFLHGLSLAMADIGSDVWSPAAVGILKRHLRTVLGERWAAALKTLKEEDSTKTNGATPKEETANGDSEGTEEPKKEEHIAPEPVSADVRRELLIQSLFDILILQNFLDYGKDTNNELESLGKSLEAELDLEPAPRKRLQNGAKEYWKRSSLLFGLLA